MKSISIVCHLGVNFVLVSVALGQSSFSFRNYDPPYVDAPVFDAQGVPLAGPNYLGELYGGATSDSLSPLLVFDSNLRREIISPFSPGYFISGSASLSVLSVPPYGWAWLQLRAWDAGLGSTYEDVAALGIGGYGESPVFYAQGNPFDQFPMPAPLIGLESFSLRPEVPEPSAVWLLLLGLPWLFWRKLFIK